MPTPSAVRPPDRPGAPALRCPHPTDVVGGTPTVRSGSPPAGSGRGAPRPGGIAGPAARCRTVGRPAGAER